MSHNTLLVDSLLLGKHSPCAPSVTARVINYRTAIQFQNKAYCSVEARELWMGSSATYVDT